MDTFIKALAGALVALILFLVLNKQNKDISALLSVLVCCMIAAVAVRFLNPVFDFFNKLETIGQFDSDMLQVLLKTVGISMLAEITCLICADSGNAALGKTLQILASCTILWLSVPVFTSLIELIEEILVSI